MKTNQTINCVIVEDEIAGQLILSNKLQKLYPNIIIQAVIDNKMDAINHLSKNIIDILFLDANIKGGTGLEIIEKLNQLELQQQVITNKNDKGQLFKYKKPYVIFITAYQQYAIDALNSNASYYILKPIQEDKLKLGIDTVLARIHENRNNKLSSILVSHRGSTINIQIDEIFYLQADGTYTYIHLQNQTIISSKHLGYYHKLFIDSFFVRCHHSYLVNVNHIREIIRQRATTLLLSNGVHVPASQRKSKEILLKMNVA